MGNLKQKEIMFSRRLILDRDNFKDHYESYHETIANLSCELKSWTDL